jgi:hypothetical protein
MLAIARPIRLNDQHHLAFLIDTEMEADTKGVVEVIVWPMTLFQPSEAARACCVITQMFKVFHYSERSSAMR